MHGLRAADIAVIALYLVGIAIIGVRSGRGLQRSADFFMPRRFGKFMMWRGALCLPWQMVLYLSAGLMAGVIVSLLTKPVPKEKRENLYALLRTPVRPGEQVEAPCTLPADAVVPERRNLFPGSNLEIPVPSRAGMTRVTASAAADDLLVCAFKGTGSAATVVLLNRGTAPKRARILWPGVVFSEIEVADPYHQNEARQVDGVGEMLIAPGAVVTATNVGLRQFR